MKPGDVLTFSRCFTVEDVQLFTQLSSDEGDHHLTPDSDGRLLIHGLLTASLPTRIGGLLNFWARDVNYRFLLPVFTGDTITCSVEITSLESHERGTALTADYRCDNQHGDCVMDGCTKGIVHKTMEQMLETPLPPVE